MPDVESDAAGRPITLKWHPRPPEVSVETEQIGDYRGKAIYRFWYRSRTDNPESSPARVVGAMFGYQDTGPEGHMIRPFFITMDDQIRWMDSHFASDTDHPFMLRIHKTLEGNGVYWTNYTFIFSAREAQLLARSEGGRRMETKTYTYDKSGKIIKTETFGE